LVFKKQSEFVLLLLFSWPPVFIIRNTRLRFSIFFGKIPVLANISIYLASGISAVAMSYLIIPFLALTPSNTKFLKAIYFLDGLQLHQH